MPKTNIVYYHSAHSYPKWRYIAFLLFVLCFTIQFVSAQCNPTPFISITGNVCTGDVLSATTNVSAATIAWQLNGSTVATKPLVFPNSGVTVAGGNGNGIGASQLQYPTRLFVDAAGNLYIPDMGNSRIQKWAPGATSGITVAGGKGVGSAANQFNRPTSVFVDSKGNIYVTDQNNNRIQKWVPGATSGVTVAGYVDYPTGIFVDANDNIYVTEQNSSIVSKWAPGSNKKVVVAGTGVYGSAPNQLSTPTGIYVDAAGNVYVCDTDNDRVQKWAPGATTGTTMAGGKGYGSNASQLANPLSVYVDAAGNIYVSDYNNYRVQKWAPGVSAGVTIAGGNGSGSGGNQFNQPHGITMDANCNLYVSDFFNARVQKFSTIATATYTTLQPGDYTATITTSTGTIISSNTITVSAPQTPQVTIVADTNNICPATWITFTAVAANGGLSPQFQWKKNGVNVGTNKPVYKDSILKTGDIISCMLISNAACIIRSTAASNNIEINVLKPHVPVNLGADVTICPGTATTLNASTGYSSYLWQDGSTLSSVTAVDAGMYSVSVRDACGSSSDMVLVALYPQPQAFLPSDTSLCQYEILGLQPTGIFQKYLWSTGAVSPAVDISIPGLYWLQVTDQDNCIGRDSIVIKPKECIRKLYVPTAFTPNGDGKNDKLTPIFLGQLQHFRFIVYNRWGKPVFSTTELNSGWDGNVNGAMQDTNTFVWICTYQLMGEPAKQEKGTITLVR